MAAYDPLHNNGCIYTPGVVVFKSDAYLPALLPEDEWYTVDVLILGAFGCGAFQNPPSVVAAAARTVVKDYLLCFGAIEFAVYCRPEHEENYTEFAKKLSVIRSKA